MRDSTPWVSGQGTTEVISKRGPFGVRGSLERIHVKEAEGNEMIDIGLLVWEWQEIRNVLRRFSNIYSKKTYHDPSCIISSWLISRIDTNILIRLGSDDVKYVQCCLTKLEVDTIDILLRAAFSDMEQRLTEPYQYADTILDENAGMLLALTNKFAAKCQKSPEYKEE